MSSPFECVLSTVPASISVLFAHQGCFHAIDNTLRLELSQGGARLSGELGGGVEDSDSTRVEPRELSRIEGERIVRELAEAVTREEVPAGCGSTDSYVVFIKWSCPSSPAQGGSLELRSDDCDLPKELSSHLPKSYERAPHVHQIAERTLKNASH